MHFGFTLIKLIQIAGGMIFGKQWSFRHRHLGRTPRPQAQNNTASPLASPVLVTAARTMTNHPVGLVMAGVALAIALAAVRLGAEAYGDRDIRITADRADASACERLGFSASSERHTSCAFELQNLREAHEKLRLSYPGY
jgi:hypothetical protein